VLVKVEAALRDGVFAGSVLGDGRERDAGCHEQLTVVGAVEFGSGVEGKRSVQIRERGIAHAPEHGAGVELSYCHIEHTWFRQVIAAGEQQALDFGGVAARTEELGGVAYDDGTRGTSGRLAPEVGGASVIGGRVVSGVLRRQAA